MNEIISNNIQGRQQVIRLFAALSQEDLKFLRLVIDGMIEPERPQKKAALPIIKSSPIDKNNTVVFTGTGGNYRPLTWKDSDTNTNVVRDILYAAPNGLGKSDIRDAYAAKRNLDILNDFDKIDNDVTEALRTLNKQGFVVNERIEGQRGGKWRLIIKENAE